MLIKFPILRLKKQDWNIDIKFLWEHVRIGFPMGFQMSVMVIGIIALQIVLNSFGSETIHLQNPHAKTSTDTSPPWTCSRGHVWPGRWT